MADNERIGDMQQQFNELRQAIANDIADRFDAGERRLREGLSKELDAKFQASEQRLTQVIVHQLETAQQHLEGRLQMHMEDLKGVVTTTAECYGGTLDRIERSLGEMNKKMDERLLDHDKTLANHTTS